MSLDRRRALMGSEKKTEPNGFVKGTFTHGQSAWTIDSDGEMLITAWKSSVANSLQPEIERTLDIKAGDSVRVVVTKISGTISVAQFADISVCGLDVLSNESWGKWKTAVDKTFTASTNPIGTSFYIGNRAGTATITSYRVRFEIYANGKKIFPLA